MSEKTDKPTVYVVHCIDVEGPMTETLEATWERIYNEDRIWMNVEPSRENLLKLQAGQLDLPGLDAEAIRYLQGKYSPANLAYLTSWEQIDASIEPAVSRGFRQDHADSTGGPYIYSWFIYDHYGFTNNPRFHDVGIHRIYDHYHDLFLRDDPQGDGVYWHYHHVAASGDALEWNPSWTTNGVPEEILARRIIERGWFPSVFRAGGHIERNDLSHWLEMFIPFDYSLRTPHGLNTDAMRGCVYDWRNAPSEWGYYHPDWYDYRRPGPMNRYLIRCLDLRTWILSLTETDVQEAFDKAREDGVTVLAYYNHDYRDMATDVEHGYGLLQKVGRQNPDVQWRFANALEAAQALTGQHDKAPTFRCQLEGSRLTIASDEDLFGPQPFLAIKENGRFFRDNTTAEGPREWVYVFRRPEEVEAFGLAGCSAAGNVGVFVHAGRLSDWPW